MEIRLKCRAQELAHQAIKPGNTVCIPWGRGIGKSWFQRLIWYLQVYEAQFVTKRPVRIVLLMPTLEQAKKVHGKLLIDELEGTWKFLGGIVNKTDWRVAFPGGSWIQFVTAERAENARGIRCDIVTVDEADDVDPEKFESVIAPWFSEPHSLRIQIIAGTPRRGRYGLLWRAHHDWPQVYPDSHFSFHATGYDAPLLVDPDYLEKTKAITTPEIFKREWLCDFDSSEGLVYPMFSEQYHVRPADRRRPYSEILIGADHGWEDPGVLLAIGVDGSGREARLHVIEEVYKSGQSDSWWIETARQWVSKYPGARWYADPSRPGLIEDWRRAGARIQDVNNDVADGVGAVGDRLIIRDTGNGSTYTRLYVDPSCKHTIREFGVYRRKRDPRNKERVLEDIQDRDNHAMDALRYAVMSRFGGPTRTRQEHTSFAYG